MSENSFKSIRNTIIASVVSGVILLAIPTLREYVMNMFSWIWSYVIWFLDLLNTSYPMSGWMWLLLGVLS